MDFLELAAKRYSVRKFTGERVKQDDIDRISGRLGQGEWHTG